MTPHASSVRARLVLLIATLPLVVVLLLPPVSLAGSTPEPLQVPYVPGEVLIAWQPGTGPVAAVQKQPGRLRADAADPSWQTAADEIRRATGLAVLGARPDHGTARLAVRVGHETAEIGRLQALGWVRLAELNYYAYAAGAGPFGQAWYPNDPDFGKQWNMHRVKAPEAWAAARGSLTFVVAVLDTGVAQSHPDFAGQLLPGYNYVSDQPGAEDDDVLSHGTHVTGILAATTNNGQGVAGLAPDIKILPLKVLNNVEAGRYDAIAAAIRDAADQRAQVINMSLTGLGYSQLLRDAVDYAAGRGALVVAAAGNCAQNPGYCGGQTNPDVYPAAFPGVLAVGASDRFDRAAAYSGYKPYVSLATPGGTAEEPVWSTLSPVSDPEHDLYGPKYGTSMSTPMAAAAAALVWTLRPAATPEEIGDILTSTADRVGTYPNSDEPLSYASGRNDYFGAGRLNVAHAVRWAYPPMLAPGIGPDINLMLGGPTGAVTRTVAIQNASEQGVYWSASVTAGAPWLSLSSANGTSLYSTPAALALRAERGALAPGVYVGVIRVQPIYPAGVEPLDLRVVLRVSARPGVAYLPLAVQNPEPAWRDPDAPGVLYRNVVPLTNDATITIGLPFPVSFYGNTYVALQASDNGLVMFGGASGRAPAACPGDGRAPNNAVYVLGYDWDPTLGGQIIVHQPDARTYVVTWQNVRRQGSGLAQSFQVVIQSDGTMRGNYRTVESPLPGIIGTENYDGAFSQQVLCNGAGRQVSSGQSVSLATKLPW